MEKMVLGFSRKSRGIDGVDQLVEALNKAATSDLSSLTDDEKRRILDFPDADTQAAAISKITALSKSELLRRAAEAPADLTASELGLLQRRYWPDQTWAEGRARCEAVEAFDTPDGYNEAHEQLTKLRAPLYGEQEEKGLSGADAEFWRRQSEEHAKSLERGREACERLIAKARPWVKRLWEEDGPAPFPQGKSWGYAVFYEPSVVSDPVGYDDYTARRDGALSWARGAIFCGEFLTSRWRTQQLDWPEGLELQPTDDTDEKSRRITFQKLREHFASIQAHPPEKRVIILPTLGGPNWVTESPGALEDGILRNVFLVMDQGCVSSTVGTMKGRVDDMWVWAVDPTYEDKLETEEAQPEGAKYRGFFRVRLQQIVNNFYELRRFHEHEYSMEKLWEISQTSRDQVFISVKDEEKNLWTASRDVGSAMRPPPPDTA